MEVFREMTIVWRGKEHSFVPSMKLMRAIEDEVSLGRIISRASTGDLPFSHANFVMTKILRAAGASVTEEDVWLELNSMGQDKMLDMIKIALSAFVPEAAQGKNLVAQTDSQSQARAAEEA